MGTCKTWLGAAPYLPLTSYINLITHAKAKRVRRTWICPHQEKTHFSIQIHYRCVPNRMLCNHSTKVNPFPMKINYLIEFLLLSRFLLQRIVTIIVVINQNTRIPLIHDFVSFRDHTLQHQRTAKDCTLDLLRHFNWPFPLIICFSSLGYESKHPRRTGLMINQYYDRVVQRTPLPK